MADLTIDDLRRVERVRAVTDNFFFWQGRRFIGLGLVLIVAVLATMPEIHEQVGNGLLIASLIVASYASSRLGRQYRHEFGHVRPIPGAHATRSRMKWLLVYPIMFGALALDLVYPVPVFVSGPVWAGAIFLYRRSTGGGRNHYLVVAAVLSMLAIVPIVTGATTKQMVSIMFLLLGASYSVCAWLDDQEMRAVMRGV